MVAAAQKTGFAVGTPASSDSYRSRRGLSRIRWRSCWCIWTEDPVEGGTPGSTSVQGNDGGSLWWLLRHTARQRLGLDRARRPCDPNRESCASIFRAIQMRTPWTLPTPELRGRCVSRELAAGRNPNIGTQAARNNWNTDSLVFVACATSNKSKPAATGR
jgi:hypothetical protein